MKSAQPSIRPAVAAERGALEALQRRASLAYEEDRALLLAHPEVIELPLGAITGGRTLVAEDAGELLGFAVVLRRDDGEAELDGLFVEPTCWRRGVGRALLARAEQLAIADGAGTLWVTANARALGFYDACGFLRAGDALTSFGTAPRLRKRLGRPS